MFFNVVVGKPLVEPRELLALNEQDWKDNEKSTTLFTTTRCLPAIMKEVGMVQSTGEVKRNKPELARTLDKPDCFQVKWGKKFLYVVVGE